MTPPVKQKKSPVLTLSRRKLILGAAAGALAVAAGGAGLIVFKDQRWTDSEPYKRTGEAPADTVVVVYSRSGNTLLAAREIARSLDADLVQIDAPAYPRSIAGQMRASDHAQEARVLTEIAHPEVDFEGYRKVVLCSPTWWFRPAIPMWAFASASSFHGSEVSLFLTGNSRYEVSNIEAFGELVQKRGGRFAGHAFVSRGRVAWQLSAEELSAKVRTLIEQTPHLRG